MSLRVLYFLCSFTLALQIAFAFQNKQDNTTCLMTNYLSAKSKNAQTCCSETVFIDTKYTGVENETFKELRYAKKSSANLTTISKTKNTDFVSDKYRHIIAPNLPMDSKDIVPKTLSQEQHMPESQNYRDAIQADMKAVVAEDYLSHKTPGTGTKKAYRTAKTGPKRPHNVLVHVSKRTLPTGQSLKVNILQFNTSIRTTFDNKAVRKSSYRPMLLSRLVIVLAVFSLL